MRVVLIIVGVFMLATIAGLVWIAAETRQDYLFAELPDCEKLPDRDYVIEIMKEHEDLILSLQDPKHGVTIVRDFETEENCPGKSALYITYDTRKTRDRIRSILGNKLTGVPYRMFNI